MVDREGLAQLMASVAGTLHQQAEIEDMLRAVVFSARDTVPGVEEAGVSVTYRNGRFDTVAATAPVVYQVDELQYQLNEGPCVDALSGDWESATGHLSIDGRWPSYAPAAARLGVESQLGLRLYDETDSVAGLNLYSSIPDAFPTEALQVAHLFAVQAAHALGRTMADNQLGDALAMRKVIGQAVGIVMERYRLTEQRAFTFLIHASKTSSTKLKNIAERIVDDAESNADQ